MLLGESDQLMETGEEGTGAEWGVHPESPLFSFLQAVWQRISTTFPWKGWDVRLGVTVLGDNQKFETQPQVCLVAHPPARDLLSDDLSGP